MRHDYECPLRWGDMDLLGHVNNVAYLDYLAAARFDLFGGLPAGRARVSSHTVEYLHPLVFSKHPVQVSTWVTGVHQGGLTLRHEVTSEPRASYAERATERGTEQATEKVVHLRARSELAHPLSDAEIALVEQYRGEELDWRKLPTSAETSPGRHSHPITLRVADLGWPDHLGNRAASDAAHFELFQEARVAYLLNLYQQGSAWAHHVVARTDVIYHHDVSATGGPYRIESRIGHLGGRSFSIEAELCDPEQVLATATVVMVSFDKESQRSRGMPTGQRERLERELAGDAE